MLSDESSSDSETGRFKCQTIKPDGQKGRDEIRSTNRPRSPGRNKHNRYNKGIDRRRDERDRLNRDKDRYRPDNKYSPVRSRPSRDTSQERSRDRQRHYRRSRERSRNKEFSQNRDRRRNSKSPTVSRNVKEETKEEEKYDRKTRDVTPPSPIQTVKKSEVYKPPEKPIIRKSDSPVVVIDNDSPEEEVQLGSYYSMIPAIVKEKSEESSEIDSSDDEKLRAKLLNLEKELHKSKKKKHKRKHKKRRTKSKEDIVDSSVEVTSTTDIQEVKNDVTTQSTEVTSTQKNNRKDSSEEGEILSEEEFDLNDLRHKLKRSKTSSEMLPKLDACGPVLPPHLQERYTKSASQDGAEAVLKDTVRNVGPSIPSEMRKILAEKSPEVTKDVSDEDGIGPLPVGAEERWSEAHQRLEERAYEMKIKKLDEGNGEGRDHTREKWMLELPEGKTKFLGLEARGFRAKAGPDMSDRSSWTDTPELKAKKAAGLVKEDMSESLQREASERQVFNRDEEQEQAVRKHKKKHRRDESLLEIHQKKLKKKKKKETEEKRERRPFSRDVDLQVNRFDEAQKKSIIKKAQNLNSRFSSGDAKYL